MEKIEYLYEEAILFDYISMVEGYVSQYKNLVNDYSRKYGSLEAFSINHDKNKWDWVDEPWPWQGGK